MELTQDEIEALRRKVVWKKEADWLKEQLQKDLKDMGFKNG